MGVAEVSCPRCGYLFSTTTDWPGSRSRCSRCYSCCTVRVCFDCDGYRLGVVLASW